MGEREEVIIVGIERVTMHARTVAQWIVDQWGDGTVEETLQRLVDSRDCPSTLVAVVGDHPIGVVGFRRFQREDDEVATLWINVLYVSELARGKGIGSRLLAKAVDLADQFPETLFVYTDLPEFYEQAGWIRCEPVGDSLPTTLFWPST